MKWLGVAWLLWMPAAALAQAVGEPLVGLRQAVNAGHDFSADVSGDTVVFTRLNGASSIFTYNVAAQAEPVEVAPQAGRHRRSAVLGHRTVVWQDFSYAESPEPEITAFNLDTRLLTRLSADASLNRTPAVSSDGSTVVWAKCAAGQTCDIWQAVAAPGGFTTQALTGVQGDESQPDTNGQVVVYASVRAENEVVERDIYWQAVGGGQGVPPCVARSGLQPEHQRFADRLRAAGAHVSRAQLRHRPL